MSRRGFLAELHHQSVQAEKRRQREAAAAARARDASARAHERHLAGVARERVASDKSDAATATRRQLEAGIALAEARNEALAEQYAQIDTLLEAILDVDDFIDLASLRIAQVEHPPFDASGLDEPAAVLALTLPPQATLNPFPEPSGLGKRFAGRKRHEAKVAVEQARYEQAIAAWQAECAAATARHEQTVAAGNEAQAAWLASLVQAKAQYASECASREAKAAEHNIKLDSFINDLSYDVPGAIEEYVGMVLGNSLYPEHFPVEHEHEFDLASRELTITVRIPAPDKVPTVKEFRYIKAKEELTSTALPVKAVKDRYAGAVHQVALRTLHEVFGADRLAKISTVTVTVAVHTIAPHSGQTETVPLVRVAADRDTFLSFDLAQVVPAATLTHLGGSLSKSPFDLVPAPTGSDVRARKS